MCKLITLSIVKSIQQWQQIDKLKWNIGGIILTGAKTKHAEKEEAQWHFVHQKSHTE